jgi:histidine triad (HIT) family protein
MKTGGMMMADCIFCKIIAGEMKGDIIHDDAETLAFRDINPQAPVHFLVIPKKHITNIMEADGETLGKVLFRAKELAIQEGCEPKGARFVINCKSDGGQTVDHLHIHVMGGRRLSWPPG